MAPSLIASGIDPGGNFPKPEVDMGKELGGDEGKAWKTVWSAGQGVGEIHDCPSTQDLVQRLIKEYRDASIQAC
jgi:nitronate monooxygenase